LKSFKNIKKYNAFKPASATNQGLSKLAESNRALADLNINHVTREIEMREKRHEKEILLIHLKLEEQHLKTN
jgi:hypothetical protein